MQQAANSVGSILKIGVTTVAKLTKIGSPEMTKAEIDVTTLDSAGGYKEYIPDFRDGGHLTFDGFAISDAGQAALKANFDSNVNENFTIELPSGVTVTFNGYVSKYKKYDVAVGQGQTFSGEIRVSGVVSFGEIASVAPSAITITDVGGVALTANVLSPAFAGATFKYVDTFTTDDAIAVKATNATANTTMLLYVNDVFVQDLLTTVESAAIDFTALGAKKVTVKSYQTNKSPEYYEFMVAKTA